MIEKWRIIEGFLQYEVSTQGHVRSNTTHGHGKFLKEKIDSRPGKVAYRRVTLFSQGKASTHMIHVLVLTAFVGPCPDGQEGCHGDSDPSNNCLSNLRWDTPINNWMDRHTCGRGVEGVKNPKVKLTPEQVLEIRVSNNKQKALAGVFGVSVSTIERIKAKATWRHL